MYAPRGNETVTRITPAFLSALSAQLLSDSEDRWQLLADLRYRSAVFPSLITVPAGFVTDFASVPRLPVVYWRYGGRARQAAVVHDFLYQTHLTSARAVADEVFAEAMRVSEVPWRFRWPMWAGVRVLGASAWNSGPERFRVLNPGTDRP